MPRSNSRMGTSEITSKDKATVFDVLHHGALGNLGAFFASPLEHTATIGDVRLMRKLLKHGASANTVCFNGESVLHLVATMGHQEAVKVLVNSGADVGAVDTKGDTALHVAARRNHAGTVAALLAAGANVDFQNGENGRTPLDVAAYRGHVAVVVTLLQGKANLKAVTSDGYTALHSAAAGNQVGTINALAEAGAFINAQDYNGETPLHIAAQENCPESVKALCELGAEKDKLDWFGCAPLHCAIESPEGLNAATALLTAGADVDLRQGGDEETSPLDLAISNGRLCILEELIERGADVTSSDSKGDTALHHAAEAFEGVGAIDILVRAGAALDAQDSKRRTPLHHASELLQVGAAHALLGHGANVNALDRGKRLPLHLAAKTSEHDSSTEMVSLLLEKNADETAVDKKGRTAAEVVRNAPDNKVVLGLLAKAPAERAERAWRRRRFFVMCRAYPDRATPKLPRPTRPERDTASGRTCDVLTRKRARLARAGGGGEDAASNVGGRVTAHRGAAERASLSGSIKRLVAGVVGMGKDDLFRKVVEFL